MPRLENKVAVITGATSGVGRATAVLFARKGAQVITGSNDPTRHEELEAEAGRLAGSIHAVEMDVTREQDAKRLIQTAVDIHGRLDILINNAGIVLHNTVADETVEQFQQVLDVNLKGVFLCSKYAVRAMRKQRRGSIVNVSSINGIRGNHRHAAYCASKGGVVSLTHAMALDHAPDGIRVNCVCPAAVERTGMVDFAAEVAEDRDAFFRDLIAKHPLGRIATLNDVAFAILFLAGDEASFITGVALPIDGGRSIR